MCAQQCLVSDCIQSNTHLSIDEYNVGTAVEMEEEMFVSVGQMYTLRGSL